MVGKGSPRIILEQSICLQDPVQCCFASLCMRVTDSCGVDSAKHLTKCPLLSGPEPTLWKGDSAQSQKLQDIGASAPGNTARRGTGSKLLQAAPCSASLLQGCCTSHKSHSICGFGTGLHAEAGRESDSGGGGCSRHRPARAEPSRECRHAEMAQGTGASGCAGKWIEHSTAARAEFCMPTSMLLVRAWRSGTPRPLETP